MGASARGPVAGRQQEPEAGDGPGRNRQLWILWGAFTASIFVHALAAVVVMPDGALDAGAAGPALAVAAVIAALASMGWSQRAQARRAASAMSASPEAPAPPSLTDYIVGWALADAVAVLGLTRALLAGNFFLFLPYAAAALGLLAMQRPSGVRRSPPL